jgi:hypothetical protein
MPTQSRVQRRNGHKRRLRDVKPPAWPLRRSVQRKERSDERQSVLDGHFRGQKESGRNLTFQERNSVVAGVAMRINVGAGLKITGQIANDQRIASAGSLQYKIVGGQRFVWEAAETGSNVGGRWVEASLAPARQIVRWDQDVLRRFQDRGGEGSMATWDHHMEGGGY